MIDIIGQPGIEVTQGIVRKRGKMQYGVKAQKVLSRQVTQVLADLRYWGRRLAKLAAGK